MTEFLFSVFVRSLNSRNDVGHLFVKAAGVHIRRSAHARGDSRKKLRPRKSVDAGEMRHLTRLGSRLRNKQTVFKKYLRHKTPDNNHHARKTVVRRQHVAASPQTEIRNVVLLQVSQNGAYFALVLGLNNVPRGASRSEGCEFFERYVFFKINSRIQEKFAHLRFSLFYTKTDRFTND